ncbi:MAG: hypothetical protein IID40_08070 [Planctomycetes bacterium]|nr:hypothetical protein [Planctomycetota bacterium]
MTARDTHHARESAPPDDRRSTPGVWICAALAALCYANTLGNGFCYDDRAIIVQNPQVTAPGYWGRLWLDDYWNTAALATPYRDLLYRPVAVLSYRFNHLVGGLDPTGYHAVNLLLHVLVTVGVMVAVGSGSGATQLMRSRSRSW